MHALFVTAHIEPTGRSPWLDVGDEAARQPRGTSSLPIRPDRFSPGANDFPRGTRVTQMFRSEGP
jgi:hypothetical protein